MPNLGSNPTNKDAELLRSELNNLKYEQMQKTRRALGSNPTDKDVEMISPSRFNRDLPPDYKNPDPRFSVDLPQGYTNPDPKMNRFKKGGKASNSKEHDWHGFGGSKTGNNNHGF
jgi:hypothetical protein